MTDREMLELAAKAAGIKTLRDPHGTLRDCTKGGPATNIFAAPLWNPLQDDGDALRMAAKLKIDIAFYGAMVVGSVGGAAIPYADAPIVEGDTCEAARRAVVLVAAQIGKVMP